MSVEFALQTAVYSALTSDASLMNLVTAIYDDVPQGDAELPYVTIGDAQHNEWDTDTELGRQVTLTLHSWSQYAGRKEIKNIQGAIYDVLHRGSLSITGYTLVLCDFVSSETFLDSDGQTRHGVQVFNVLIEKN